MPNKPIIFRFSFLISLTLMIATGCGGGGGGSDGSSVVHENPLDSLPYTGLRSAAVINSADIEAFMLSAYFDSTYLYALEQNTSTPVLQQNTLQVSNVGVQELFSEYGPCGGIQNLELEVDENTGDFYGNLIYDGFDDCEYIMTGTIRLSGQLDLQSEQFNSLTMVFELLVIRMALSAEP